MPAAPILIYLSFPDILPETTWSTHLGKTQHKAMDRFRKRMRQRGMVRLDIHVRKDDAGLVRNVVRALVSPDQEQAARAVLRRHFGGQTVGLKALLAAAPLDGIDLGRRRDFGRNVDL
jgi:hypothetical protein